MLYSAYQYYDATRRTSLLCSAKTLRRWLLLRLALLVLLLQAGPSSAAEDAAPAPPAPPWRETWVGAEATAAWWSFYSGVTFAPFGSITEDGWRARVTGGTGRYRYAGNRTYDGIPEHVAFRGTSAFADALIGYQWTLGPVIVKAFAGIAADGHTIDPVDPDNGVQGLAYGPKLALDVWWSLSPRWWSALDASWTSAHDQYGARVRLGYRLWPELSVGIEAGALGNASYHAGKVGALVRYELSAGEISLSAGVTGDYAKPDTLYGSAVWLLRY